MLMKNVYLIFFILSNACFLTCSCSDSSHVENASDLAPTSEGDVLNREAQRGKQTLSDGSIFTGEMLGGNPHGYGKREFESGDTYEGQFKKGMAHGHGTYRYKDDQVLDRFLGMWASGKWNGYGTLVLNDGSRVTGQWEKNRLEYGDYEGSDGTIRSGKWRGNWEFLEEGFFLDSFGSEFNGLFNNDGSYKKGFIKNPNGDSFAGEFFANAYHGRGILEKADGSLYVGGFEDNTFSGTGMLLMGEGSIYMGEFLEDLPNGYGMEEQVNGVRYFGLWENGFKQGMGTVDFGNGASFVGEFKDGLAFEGKYDWGDGRVTDSYQDEFGNWLDR
jgi:hypothetical protein